jgi:predicted nucleic acid-binding protein
MGSGTDAMIFDTDVFIWVQRGNRKAAALIDGATERFLSVQTLMELLQCAKNKEHQRITKKFLADFGFAVLPLTENIGHRALVYVEEYGISSGMRAGDAIVAATAVEHGMLLATSNSKHFRSVRDLDLQILRP